MSHIMNVIYHEGEAKSCKTRKSIDIYVHNSIIFFLKSNTSIIQQGKKRKKSRE